MENEKDNKKIDYLEVDQPIPGQNYVCMSFLSPETLIQNREAFNCAKFLQSYCKDLNLKFDDVYEKYKDFTYKHEDKLQRDFDEKNDFQTSLRGIKIRGVFNTKEEANNQAKKLSTVDSSFHVFIGQVGYWLPWDPNADKVEDEVFQNNQLNDMMEKYQENNINRDIFYEEQKRERIKEAREEQLRLKKKKLEENKEKMIEDEMEPEPMPDEPETVTDEMEPEPETDEPVEEIINENVPTSENKVDSSITDSFESDPWIQRKMEKTE
uniref:Uncharacterized protein n=1 Tax=viral metagenome TaxID=1070528 RepID=A0A6C0BSY4_9ZZZZ